MLNTKEFYQVMDMFERDSKSLIQMGSMGLKKENKYLWKIGQYYCDGNVNNAFKIYLSGVSLGKILYL